MNDRERNRPRLRIGITGGIGCGKSLAGEVLEDLGVTVLDTDQVARDLLQPGEPVYQEVARLAGEEASRPDGSLRRDHLAALLFHDPGFRGQVEAVMHPAIRDRVARWLEDEGERAPEGAAAVLVPLLFEAGFDDLFTHTLCVVAEDEVALDRCEARGMDRGDAALRQAAQWPVDRKAERADTVLRNQRTPEDFRRDVRAWFEQLA